jgi:uncharacterized protein YdeI (YjbR/CyaY-like superfamily)
MRLPDDSKILAFENAEKLCDWLKKNHNEENELFVKIYKKGSGKPSVTWNDVVIESLCWGWIDGVKKSLDEEAYIQRITPRKPGSSWSKKNTEHVERLINEGRMQDSGLQHVYAAKKDGRWENAYAPPSQMKVPADFLAAVNNSPKIKAFYDTLKKTNLYPIAYGLETAKKPETRQRRFDKFMDMLSRGETPDFGFKKKS